VKACAKLGATVDRAALDEKMDWQKQNLLLFAWDGYASDKFTYQVTKGTVRFSFEKGKLVPDRIGNYPPPETRVKLFAVSKEASRSVTNVRFYHSMKG